MEICHNKNIKEIIAACQNCLHDDDMSKLQLVLKALEKIAFLAVKF